MIKLLKTKANQIGGNFRNKLTAKKKGDKAILVELGLAVVGVAVLIIFRTQITAIVTNVAGQVQTWITNLFTA